MNGQHGHRMKFHARRPMIEDGRYINFRYLVMQPLMAIQVPAGMKRHGR